MTLRQMPAPSFDGTLTVWQDLAPRYAGAALLAGNGLSINVWPAFAYGSLFDQARTGGLTREDLALFGEIENFERVLSDLATAIRVNETLCQPTQAIYERYRSIQRGLGHAVRAVHLTRSQIPDATLRAIRQDLVRYEWIFTTSYDLLLYWAMGSASGFAPFVDHFVVRASSSILIVPTFTPIRSRSIFSMALCTLSSLAQE